MITVRCQCGQQYHAAEDHVGRAIRCRSCGRILTVARAEADPRAELEVPESQDGSTGLTKRRAGTVKRRKSIALLALAAAIVAVVLIGIHTPAQPESHAPAVQPQPASVRPRSAQLFGPPFASKDSSRPQVRAPDCVADQLQPAAGAELARGLHGGLGILQVQNGTERDAVVALVDPGGNKRPRRVYVPAGQTDDMTGIPAGDYRLRFALGSGYSSRMETFCVLTDAEEFDRAMIFSEVRTERGIRYREEQITLQKIINGNATSHAIDARLVFADSF